MKKLLFLTVTIITAFALTSGTATATEVNKVKNPTVVEYPTKMGKVTFNHNKHQQIGDCSSCHHTGDNKQCKSCHGTDKEIPSSKTAYHKQCKSCHSENKLGPTNCKGCHIR